MTDTDRRAATILRVHAVITLVLGAFLVLDSWDGLYQRLDLPQSFPALLTQVGGVFVIMFGFLLWRAAAAPGELRSTVTLASAAGHAGAAGVVIAAWLIFRDRIEACSSGRRASRSSPGSQSCSDSSRWPTWSRCARRAPTSIRFSAWSSGVVPSW